MLDVDVHFMTPTSQILGIKFFNGSVDEAVQSMVNHGGFLIAPSGTCFARLRHDADYRCAVLAADLAIADSGLMVVLYRLLSGKSLQRISGLKYLKRLLPRLKAATGKAFWIVPNDRAAQRLLDWSSREALLVTGEDYYVAPRYGSEVVDPTLVARIERLHPKQVIIAIGSGAQEKLGHYLREHLSYRPAIHCLGAALGFLTGDQIAIPDWADRVFLGWLWRLFAQPRTFIPRLSRGLELPALLWKYGDTLPPMRKGN
jgi:N-acetylglucosaminyldiphosphoundecaprenol N-acetyl-beta-D-mannosaminyltransferase